MDRYLAAIQVGITMVGLALGWVGEPALAQALKRTFSHWEPLFSPGLSHALSFALALGILTLIQVVLGELLPRTIALQNAERIALWGAYPLRIFALMIRPAVALASFLSLFMTRLLGLKPASESESPVSEEELRVLLGESQEKGRLPLERLLLLENLFDLAVAKVSDAMVPREKVVFLSLKKTWAENLETIRSRRFSRYPLCEDGLDSVIGLVHVKDLVLRSALAEPDFDPRRARRDISEALEADPLEKLLRVFPDKGIHMSVVRNGAGQVSGIITLEDIMEEIIGEVHDEFDLPQAWSLMDVLVPAAVAVNLAAPDRRGVIAVLLGRLAAAHGSLRESETLQLVWDRERKFSSAVGRGVAVPHARLANLERPLVALGRFSPPVAFPTPDNVPVRLVFLILTPASTPVLQLKVLGRIAAIVTNDNIRRRLLRARTAESLIDTLRTADTLIAQ